MMIGIAALLVLFLNDAQAMSTGAPSTACAGISPQFGHGGSSLSLASSPFLLNITQLTAAGGYIPGTTYSLVLTGTQQYRGLLVQGRNTGSNPVGMFSSGSQVQTACSANSAVTHVDSTLKNNVQLSWTAPPQGTGNVTFSYAVVVQNSGGVNTYYATLTSPPIAELAAPTSQASTGAGGGSASSISMSNVLILSSTLLVLGMSAVHGITAF